jgi:hypothetical protein
MLHAVFYDKNLSGPPHARLINWPLCHPSLPERNELILAVGIVRGNPITKRPRMGALAKDCLLDQKVVLIIIAFYHWQTTALRCVPFGVFFPKETRRESEIEFKDF